MKYRKKPVVIDALRVPPPCTDDNIGEHGAFAMQLHMLARGAKWEVANGLGEINIRTLEGVMLAKNGDWVIRGVQGEIYPCKPDIFAATYEVVE